jgi:N-acetylmuramoyl-L-alanine amidase
MFKGRTQWYPIAGKVVLRLYNHKIEFSIDSRTTAIGSKKVSLTGPIRQVRGTIFIPVDFFLSSDFSELVDCRVSWNPQSLILNAEPRVSLFPPRIYSRPSLTRIVIESAVEVSPEIKKKDSRILVDIPKVRIAGEETVRVNDKVVESVTVSNARKGALLKVTLAKNVTSYAWFQEKDPPRLILEFQNPSPSGPSQKEEFKEVVPPERQNPASAQNAGDAKSPAASPQPSRIKRIVVDAGHGGKDPGAVGRLGTKEKDINLLIALELARILRIEGGYEVLLTRTDDTFVSLIDRSLFSNNARADLFISIHCNASVRKREGGFEIYFLAEDASDAHAEATAELENAVIELEGPPSERNKKAQEVLSSMARTEFINESSLLCSTIDRAVTKGVSIQNRGVKQADFHVLHGVQMPSVLVETAFITASQDEQKLRRRRYRTAMVDAILTGIQNYENQLALLK